MIKFNIIQQSSLTKSLAKNTCQSSHTPENRANIKDKNECSSMSSDSSDDEDSIGTLVDLTAREGHVRLQQYAEPSPEPHSKRARRQVLRDVSNKNPTSAPIEDDFDPDVIASIKNTLRYRVDANIETGMLLSEWAHYIKKLQELGEALQGRESELLKQVELHKSKLGANLENKSCSEKS